MTIITNIYIHYIRIVKQLGIYSLIGIFLLSISGLQISFHSCEGELKSLAVFTKAEACSHYLPNQQTETPKGDCCGESTSHCHRVKKEKSKSKGKCSDDKLLTLNPLKIELSEVSSLSWTPNLDFTLFIESPWDFKVYNTLDHEFDSRLYKPPSTPLNIQVFHQVFLI